MKTYPIPKSYRRRFCAFVFLFISLFTPGLSLHAADWYLRQDQALNTSWGTPVSDWTASANGSGGSPGSFSLNDTFDTNGHFLRSPVGTGTYVFGGGALRLGGATGTLALKTYNGGVSEFVLLVGRGGRVLNYSSGVQNVRCTRFENESGLRFSAASNRGLHLSADVMTGAGEITVVDVGVLQLDVADATNYIGDIVVSTGSVDFVAPLNSGGRLWVESGGTVHLNASVTLTGLVIAGTSLDEGTYAFSTLQALYPAVFTGGVSTASLTVRAPFVWHLNVDQPVGHDWSTLGDWNSQAGGSGVAPVIMNPHDIYAAEVSGRRVRTPAVSSTFPGGVLALGSGTQLLLKSSAGQVSTVPALATSGTPTITNGLTGIVQSLSVGDWEIGTGTTKLLIASTNGLDLSVDRLSGPGTLQTQNSGAFNLSVGSGRGFTGTLLHLSGTLTLDSLVLTGGSLSVGSGASLALDHPGYFTKITIAGTQLSSGFHGYDALHATYPSSFPSGETSAFLAVYTPATAGPGLMFGVNLAGAEFHDKNIFPGTYGSQWIYPTAAEFDYYHAKGLDLVRIPFAWERMQPSLGGALDATELGRMDTVVGYAAARGMKVVLDMHNYARRTEAGVEYLIGTGPVSVAHLADAWRRLADHYKNETSIYAYGIMNEPHDTAGTWPAMAQAAVNAIREVDLEHYVSVSGDSWANASGWAAKNPNLDTQDPADRLVYEAHCYFDDNNSGTYNQGYDAEGAYPMIGVDRVSDFVEWLQARGAAGFVGEYGVPRDDNRWLTVLDNMLAYLQSQGVSGTYWAGGPWWPSNYLLSCEPTNNLTVDRPQMSVLEQYQ